MRVMCRYHDIFNFQSGTESEDNIINSDKNYLTFHASLSSDSGATDGLRI